jgi:hypothetical protein
MRLAWALLFSSDYPEDFEILKRSSLLSILLLVATGLVGWRIYMVWQEEPWSLPQPKTVAPAALQDEPANVLPPLPTVTPDLIISKNLFDPERGAGATREAEFNSRSFQRIRNMVLLGTVILGESRSAIIQDPGTQVSTSNGPAAPAGPMRVKLGDSVEGFRLSEIGDRRVVFTEEMIRHPLEQRHRRFSAARRRSRRESLPTCLEEERFPLRQIRIPSRKQQED